MINIECRLYAALRKYAPSTKVGEAIFLELPDKTTISELFKFLKIPRKEVKRVFVEGVSRDPNYTLSDNDRVAIFPPIAGG